MPVNAGVVLSRIVQKLEERPDALAQICEHSARVVGEAMRAGFNVGAGYDESGFQELRVSGKRGGGRSPRNSRG